MTLTLAWLGIFACIYGILGTIILAAVPSLRLTVLNILIFILAAYLGSLLFRLALLDLLGLLGGSLVGGVAVWLKILWLKTPPASRWL
jgi:hypothetical protein